MFNAKFDVNDYTMVELQAAFALLESDEVQEYIHAQGEVEKAYDKVYGKAYDLKSRLLDGTNSNGKELSYSERSSLLENIMELEGDVNRAIGAATVYGRIVRDKVWTFACVWNDNGEHESISHTKVRCILNEMFDSFGIPTL